MNGAEHAIGGLYALLTDPATLICVGTVALLGAWAMLLMWRARGQAQAQLSVLVWPPAPLSAKGSTAAAALMRGMVRELPDGRSLLVDSPSRLLDDWLSHEVLRRARFEAGAWITGTALFFTFFLIAMVLANDVGPAIAGTGKESMSSLAHAVRTMGAKFVVSMVGIAMSIFHGFLRARVVHSLHSAAVAAAQRLRDGAVSVQDFQLECAERQLACAERVVEHGAGIWQALQAQHSQTDAGLARILDSIENLKSIDVSVRDIGSELQKTLQQTVKRDIVEGIRNELQAVVNGLQDALTKSFAANLNEQVASIIAELVKIEVSVAAQTQRQGHDLRDAVSGGFATESAHMKDVMSQFVSEIPPLIEHLRAFSQSTSEDLARRSDDQSRASAELFQRLELLLARLSGQQEAAVSAGVRMQEFVSQAEHMLSSSLASAHEQLSSRSQAAVQRLTEALHTATGDAAGVYRSLVSEVDTAAKALQQARADAVEGARRLNDASDKTREPLQRMTELVNAMSGAASTFDSSVQQARRTLEQSAQVVKTGSDAVTHHQLFIQELTRRWPELAREHLVMSDEAFGKIATSWRSQAENIGESVGRIGESFASSAVTFADAVTDFSDQLERLGIAKPPPKGAGGPRT